MVLAQHGLAQDGFASLDDFEFITESDGTVSWGWRRPGHVTSMLTSDWLQACENQPPEPVTTPTSSSAAPSCAEAGLQQVRINLLGSTFCSFLYRA